MKITILAIGKKHDPRLADAIEDYSKRLSHYTTINWLVVEAKITSSMSVPEIISAESDALLMRVQPGSVTVLLDEHGTMLGSDKLADKLQGYMNSSVKELVFIIGGAFGVSEQLKDSVNFTWSLSGLVFPHQIVRLILAEQLYRAHTILAGEKYHHK